MPRRHFFGRQSVAAACDFGSCAYKHGGSHSKAGQTAQATAFVAAVPRQSVDLGTQLACPSTGGRHTPSMAIITLAQLQLLSYSSSPTEST